MNNKGTLEEDLTMQSSDKEVVIKDVEINERSTQFYIKEFLSGYKLAIPLLSGEVMYIYIEELTEFQHKHHKKMYWWYLDQLDDDRLRTAYRLECVHFGYKLQKENEEEQVKVPMNEKEDPMKDPSSEEEEEEEEESFKTTQRPPTYEYLSE
ncbi:hypothetical protein FNV43_RR27320 [Rhamnella rubrinervis]|uniref:Uncharacterized protein n=1 Tax=Rhamnella rubrinervis TaxID=2594499 RepID=A0A8K0GSF1_9ROSA|nr:hypothetical protein FNV43_RR27320 [Rhamnella rubrinervis]